MGFAVEAFVKRAGSGPERRSDEIDEQPVAYLFIRCGLESPTIRLMGSGDETSAPCLDFGRLALGPCIYLPGQRQHDRAVGWRP
jgi:hypothetical protein